MSQHFPERLDPQRFADLGKRIAGYFPLASMDRLAPLLVDAAGRAEFELGFERSGGRALIRGWVRADLRLECQRCRAPMLHAVVSDVCLALVEGLDEMETLPEEYDPLMLEEPTVRLADLLEDELLLNLPQVPMHEPGECEPPASRKDSLEAQAAAPKNPFAVLAELKRK